MILMAMHVVKLKCKSTHSCLHKVIDNDPATRDNPIICILLFDPSTMSYGRLQCYIRSFKFL
jgi:hypothetical protein